MVTSGTETNGALVREYGDQPELAAKYLTSNVRWHGRTLGTIEGRDNVIALSQGFIGGLPDLDAVAPDDLVAVRAVINATHRGPLFGIPPAGRHMQWTAIDVYRIEDGKIADESAVDDLAAILHDVEVHSPPWLS